MIRRYSPLIFMLAYFLWLGHALHGQTLAPTSSFVTTSFITTTTLSIPTGCKDVVTQTSTAVTIVQTCTYTPAIPPLTGNATIAIPNATVGKLYSVNVAPLIAAKNGVPPYTYSAGSGFPAWLKISQAGILAGTPTTTGTFNLTIITSDSAGGTSAKNVVITSAAISGR